VKWKQQMFLALYQTPMVSYGDAVLTWDKDQVYVERGVDMDADIGRVLPFFLPGGYPA
jgi:hypothetical protein